MRKSAYRNGSAFRPMCEALENRWVPTTVSLHGNTLEIDGNGGANRVEIWQDDATNTLRVRYDNGAGMATRVYSSSQIRNIEVDLEGGADRFSYDLGSNFTRRKDIEIEMDSGLDRVNMNMGMTLLDANGIPIIGGPNNRPLAGRIEAQLDIDIDAGHDADEVWVDVGPVNSANVSVEVDLDRGNDVLYAGVWGDLTGTANVRFEADGEDDNDIMRFAGRFDVPNNEFEVDIAAQAVLAVDFDGGSGTDLVRASMINEIDGRLNILLQGGSGNDSGTAADGVSLAGVSTSITIKPDSTGILDARLYGNSGNDSMGFTLDNQSMGLVSIVNALLDGGTGTDSYATSGAVTRVNFP